MHPIAYPLQVSDKNKSPHYLPVKQKFNEFSWDSVTGMVLANVLQQDLQSYSLEEFRSDCQAKFKELLSETEVWDWLDHMYFTNDAVLKVSPLFLLFKAQKAAREEGEDAAANHRMRDMFSGLLGDFKLDDRPRDNLHFIEQAMLDVLERRMRQPFSKPRSKEHAYLPFLAAAFQRDLQFLAAHPQYMMSELSNTLKLFAFSYCAQLALAIHDWRKGPPQPKELYFILDFEKASSERDKIRERGYRLLADASRALFPVLSAREVMQPEGGELPLWKMYADAQGFEDQRSLIDDINRYLVDFAPTRGLEPPPAADNLEAAFAQFIDLAVKQFSSRKSERHGVNSKYVGALEKKIFADFVMFRGRAGNVLMLNQDQLLLLTNLAIGQKDKLRFFELLRAYEQRGFFFDNKSQQVLIEFFERMGNVERMSDSGEAVYVRKTV